VVAEIQRARPGIKAADDAARARYIELVAERGQLDMVIAKSRSLLGG